MWQDLAVSGVSTSSHLTTKSHHHISTPGKLLPSNGAPVKMDMFCSWEDNRMYSVTMALHHILHYRQSMVYPYISTVACSREMSILSTSIECDTPKL